MNSKQWAIAAVGLAGALSAGAAMARGNDDIQWSVTIGTPVGTPVYAHPAPVVAVPAPVYTVPVHDRRYERPARWDRDGDGIPNRYDRVYNPRWDRDGDGIPNRHDRVYNPRWDRDGDGIPNRHDRHYRYDDRYDDRYRRGWGR